MSTLYWICFLLGGSFVTLSVLGGLDGSDFEIEADTDVEIFDPQRPDQPPTNRDRNRPWFRINSTNPSGTNFSIFTLLLSVKFWTFGLCFFGLTGLVFTSLQPQVPALLVTTIALGMGLLLGILASGVLQLLRRRTLTSLVKTEDLVGLIGEVELPLDVNSSGKVWLMAKGTRLSLIAQTNEPEPLTVGQTVVVVGTERNRVWVAAAEGLNDSDQAGLES